MKRVRRSKGRPVKAVAAVLDGLAIVLVTDSMLVYGRLLFSPPFGALIG
jgi:hypothetical protein